MPKYRLGIAALAALAAGLALALPASAATAQGSGCIAHRPAYVEDVFESQYTAGCSGHDEPELMPLSNAAGSAQDLTWTVVLPTDRSHEVADVGPAFWFGGTVDDPNSLFGQAFEELQFYPDGIVTNCNPNGAFVLKHVPNTYTVCSPTWSIHATGQKPNYHEPAAFNAMLVDSTGTGPLVMHAGDTVTIHWFVTPARDGFHVTVKDLSTGRQGTIVLDSKDDGPLMPSYSRQQLGNSLLWGAVHDAPNSFVWEIGHTSPYTSPASAFCVPGQTICQSYDAPSWAGTSPIQIKGVTFGDGSAARQFAVVSDFGGRAEVDQYCGAANYGSPFCIYPWFTLGTSGFHYGVNYPDTVKDYGQVAQFQTETNCDGPFGTDSTYCSTILR
jgi:hypothetical protein